MMKRALSVLLLFSFFALVTPRNWWHDCHHGQISKSTQSKVHFEDGSFDLCDFELGYYTVHSFHFFQSPKPSYCSVISAELLDKESISFPSFSLRGPPQNA
ncbi:MAG: hypothetical protein NWR96_08655 [Crocinitomicaceae bacterium]|nr:hypothetical protein [Crocinitomicaceae bacterium]MDP4761692.1 hypothetical protein [Crocinitomicaceae bacterium]